MNNLKKEHNSLLEPQNKLEEFDKEVVTITLEEMLLGITPDDLEDEIDFGRPVGKEIL